MSPQHRDRSDPTPSRGARSDHRACATDAATGLARARNDVARLVEETNRAIMRVDAEAPTLRQHRRSLDLAVELARLDRAADGQPPGAVGS
ncbi:MAG: hypothetical protein ACXW4T_04380 [Candidatus Limnocylindrales bacterium]